MNYPPSSSSPEPVTPLLLEPRLHFDAAFIGWAHRPGDLSPVAIYDYEECVKATQFWLDCDATEAAEWVDYNTMGSWFGPGTPLILPRARMSEFEALL